jgi:hypothetical protein
MGVYYVCDMDIEVPNSTQHSRFLPHSPDKSYDIVVNLNRHGHQHGDPDERKNKQPLIRTKRLNHRPATTLRSIRSSRIVQLPKSILQTSPPRPLTEQGIPVSFSLNVVPTF